jgi:hypothetical protein
MKCMEVSNVPSYLQAIQTWDATDKIRLSSSMMVRGESKDNCKTSCLSSLGRMAHEPNAKVYDKAQVMIEKMHLSEWVRLAEGSDEVSYPEDEWLRVMWARHHGLKCRLTDWSTNPLVGLYFACNNDLEDDGYVYLCVSEINKRRDFSTSPFLKNGELYEPASSFSQAFQRDGTRNLSQIFVQPPTTFHKRIHKQSGVFHLSVDISKSILYSQEHPPLLMLKILSKDKPSIIRELNILNINKTSLGIYTPDSAAAELNQLMYATK